MGRVAVTYVIALAGLKREPPAALNFRFEQAAEAEHDVALGTPVIGEIAGRILDHAHSDVSEGLRAPEREAGLAGMGGGLERVPRGSRHGEAWDSTVMLAHAQSQTTSLGESCSTCHSLGSAYAATQVHAAVNTVDAGQAAK